MLQPKNILLIAETAWHHDGDFDFIIDLIKKIISQTETDYIKLHLSLDFDEYMSKTHLAYDFLKKRLFSKKQWEEILNLVQNSNKKSMLLFNDKAAIDLGMKYEPELVEIHSVCLNDLQLLQHLKKNVRQETKIVLGVGGSTLYEIENAINILGSQQIVLMHGFQNYPTKYSDINLLKIQKIMQLYPQFEHGYADHTSWDHKDNILITLFGASLGMKYIEKHITTAFGEQRTDWQAAISFEMFNDLETKIKLLNACLGDGNLTLNKGENNYSIFGPNKKAGILNKNISAQSRLKEEDIDLKRTKNLTDLSQIDLINSFGKELKHDLQKGHCLQKSDIKL